MNRRISARSRIVTARAHSYNTRRAHAKYRFSALLKTRYLRDMYNYEED